jgi:hypothetical protein
MVRFVIDPVWNPWRCVVEARKNVCGYHDSCVSDTGLSDNFDPVSESFVSVSLISGEFACIFGFPDIMNHIINKETPCVASEPLTKGESMFAKKLVILIFGICAILFVMAYYFWEVLRT